jgi:TPR repeat protein
MRRLKLLALLTVTTLAPHLALGAENVEDRIKQGLDAATGTPPPPPTSTTPGLGTPGISSAPALGESDASLDAATGAGRLRTTLDPLDIEQRIDKGLTAAGEESAFAPDYAFGAYQRGWFLTAFSLALERAGSGDRTAQTLLGVLLSRGLGVKQDLAAAADWYRLAGNAGDAEALYALGQLYLDGTGVEQNVEEAATLFRKAADENQPGAARELGYMLLQGKGIEKNPMLAAAYLRRAAGLGDMDAQYTLAGLFVDGVGVVADETQGTRWFAEAAKNGHVGAAVEYAIMLLNGRGTAKNEAEAAYWLNRAAELDNPVAQLRLARLNADGIGVGADSAVAARWYLIAKDQGLEDERLETVLGRLDAEELKAARAAADEWARLKRGVFQTAMAPGPAAAPVDNSAE